MGFSEIAKMNPHRETEEMTAGAGAAGQMGERGGGTGRERQAAGGEGRLHPGGPPADDQHRHRDGHPPPLMSPVTAEHAAMCESTN